MTPSRLNGLTDGVVAIVPDDHGAGAEVPEEPTLAAVLTVLPLLAPTCSPSSTSRSTGTTTIT
jgi:hypothetical protein